MGKTPKSTSCTNSGSLVVGQQKPHQKQDEDEAADDDDEEEDEEEDCSVNITTPVMISCLASHEFEWLTPTTSNAQNHAIGKDINHGICEDRSTPIQSATIPPQPHHKSRHLSGSRPKRSKERDCIGCHTSPITCFDSHGCRHRASPMRSSWCCSSPPPHSPPMCMHRLSGGSLTGMELVPYGQEYCSDDPPFVPCYCLPPMGRQHVRHYSPCNCHHYDPLYGECGPNSPQHSYRTSQRTLNARRKEFSPSSSPHHRPYATGELSHLTPHSRSSSNVWDEHWKPPIHPDDVTNTQKIQHLEYEKKNLLLQVSVLNDQIDAQSEKIRELEALLEAKKDQLIQAEQNLHQEMMTRSAVENGKLELMTEISNLRLRLTASERDRKESDERCRRIECNMSLHNRGESDQPTFRSKMFQNGPVISGQRSYEVEKLRQTVESLAANNEEKDRRIEELSQALIKCRKLRDIVAVENHHKAVPEIASKNVAYYEGDFLRDTNSRTSHRNENVKVYARGSGKIHPQQSHMNYSHLHSDELSHHERDASGTNHHSSSSNHLIATKHGYSSIHKSNSLEDIHQTACKAAPFKSPYSTIPRQSGSQVLHHLHEQLQNLDSNPLHSSSNHRSPLLSDTRHVDELNRVPRNKSTGVSFGKGFFKLRSGKRSSSAPELAPFESVTIPVIDREVSSATPTPQPTMQPFFIKPDKERSRGFFKFLTKWKRSGSQNIEKLDSDFRRGGIRSTAGPRLGWTKDISIDFDIPFTRWDNDTVVEWLHKIGLSMYVSECKKWRCNGEKLLNSSATELEKELNIKSPLHKKKLVLALKGVKSEELPSDIKSMDYQWVVRWLDDVGLPQYKDSFAEARVDGRMLHYLTIDDLLSLKVFNQLHHISIKRGIQVLREKNFDPHCLIRRSVPEESKSYNPDEVALWTNHRVMEWLRTVDLSEYAPNLRGSGVHGALIVYEPKFNEDLLATLLNIPPMKTLLRRHLATHFKTIVGAEYVQLKRDVEADQQYIPLTPNIKIKGIRKPPFSTKKKSKSDVMNDDFVCPMDIRVGTDSFIPSKEKLIVRRNSDPTLQESRLFNPNDETTADEIGAVSKEITSLTDMLNKEKLKNVPTTNV